MVTISTVIMTKNEALDIEDCIKSVSWSDEIVVLDCGSTDGTQAICRNYQVRVVDTDWPGFGEQSNRALELANSDWVFLIDADERVTPELKQEMLVTINQQPKHSAYKIPRLTYFYNRALKHCFNPKGDTPVRLIKKGSTVFKNVVHQSAVVNGSIGKLNNYLTHFPFRNLHEMLEKMNSYSTLGVENLLAKKIKPSISKAFLHGIWCFTKLYFFKRGFLDGYPGFLIALSNFEGTFYRYAKLLEYSKNVTIRSN